MTPVYTSLLSSYQVQAGVKEPLTTSLPNHRKLLKHLPQIQCQRRSSSTTKLDCRILFTPQSKFMILWQLLNVILIYMYFMQIPITIAFENHRSEQQNRYVFQMINFPAIVILLVGIIIRFKTAYYQEGVLISDPKKVRNNYLKGPFFVDVASIFVICVYEFAEVLSQHDKPVSYRFIVALFYLKIGQLLFKQRAIINSFDLHRRMKAFFKLLLLLTKIFLMCNIAACGFFYLSDNVCGLWTDCSDCCWIRKTEFNGESLKKIDQFSLQYTYSLYWASTTMISIGYGDITPQNQYQIAYTIVIQFVSCLLFAYAVNEIWSIIQQLNAKKDKIHYRMNIINVYMRDKSIDPVLKSKINAYLAHYYNTKNLRERDLQEQIISELTPELSQQLYYQSYGAIFRFHPFFSMFNAEIAEIASRYVTQMGYFQDQQVYSPTIKQPIISLYYVCKGELMSCMITGNRRQSMHRVQKQQTIGLYQFTNQINYQSTLVTIKYSLIYRIRFDNWKQVLLRYSQDTQKFYETRYLCLVQHKTHLLYYKCYYCGVGDHRTERCFSWTIAQSVKNFIARYKQSSERKRVVRGKHCGMMVHEIKKRPMKKVLENAWYVGRRRKLSIDINRLERHDNQLQYTSHLNENQLRNSHESQHGHHGHHQHSHDHHMGQQWQQGKRNRFESQLHLQRMDGIIQRKRRREQFDSSSSASEQVIKASEINVDKVQNYEGYFPKWNSDVEIVIRERRRITVRGFN